MFESGLAAAVHLSLTVDVKTIHCTLYVKINDTISIDLTTCEV